MLDHPLAFVALIAYAYRYPAEVERWLTPVGLVVMAWALISWALSRRPLTIAERTLRVSPERVGWRGWIAGGLWAAMITYQHAVYSQTGFWLPNDQRSSEAYAVAMFAISFSALIIGSTVGVVLWWKGRGGVRQP